MPVWLLRHYSMYVVGIQLHQNRYVCMYFFSSRLPKAQGIEKD